MSRTEFERKFDRALDQLEMQGLIFRGNWLINALNWPVFKLQRALKLRPIFYVSMFEQWIRGYCILLLCILAPTFYRFSNHKTVNQDLLWLALLIPITIISIAGVFYIRWQAKRKKLSRWEDL